MKITEITKLLALSRKSGIFMIEISVRPDETIDVQSHATLRCGSLEQVDVVEALLLALQSASDHYKLQFAELLKCHETRLVSTETSPEGID